jgi:hypothetical protein
MKRQIRRSVFETNSSSMHSLIIMKENAYYTEEEVRQQLQLSEAGMLRQDERDTDFGKSPLRVLTTMKDKIFYTMGALCKYKNDEVYREICDAIRSYIPEFVDIDLKLRISIYPKWKWSEEEIRNEYGPGNYMDKGSAWYVKDYELGYVNRGSNLQSFFEEYGITVREFLCNKRYVVVTDGDEDRIYFGMKALGLINDEEIEVEYTPDAPDPF